MKLMRLKTYLVNLLLFSWANPKKLCDGTTDDKSKTTDDKSKTIFDLSKIFVPINIPKIHWMLLVIFVALKKIRF